MERNKKIWPMCRKKKSQKLSLRKPRSWNYLTKALNQLFQICSKTGEHILRNRGIYENNTSPNRGYQ